MQVNPLVIDLSHWDPAYDYDAVVNDGIVGVIYKATEGTSYTDPTYVSQQHAAKSVGLKWGAYHFADGSDVEAQIDNFLRFAAPDPDELFCLDWEDNGSDTMPLDCVKEWIDAVETRLGRPNECVLYGGNTIKEALGDDVDEFLSRRRLWLCQYGNTPEVQVSWDRYWIWQFTDGVYGPSPHSVDGVGPCDVSAYGGDAVQLMLEWASGQEQPEPPEPVPPDKIVTIIVAAPRGTIVKVRTINLGKINDRRRRSERRHRGW
jgi:lysozyme